MPPCYPAIYSGVLPSPAPNPPALSLHVAGESGIAVAIPLPTYSSTPEQPKYQLGLIPPSSESVGREIEYSVHCKSCVATMTVDRCDLCDEGSDHVL